MRVVPLTLGCALGTLALAAPLAAQQGPIVSGAEIDAALSTHADAVDARRAAVRRTLERAEVAAVAKRMGVDPTAAQDAIAGLEGERLARAAAAAGDVEEALAGGADVLTIQATTLIIVLLVVIIVILIA